MMRSEHQTKLPVLERGGKGDGLIMCPVPTPSVLINKRPTKVTNFWRSPYNEVFRIAKMTMPNRSTLPDVSSPLHSDQGSLSLPPSSLPPSSAHEDPSPCPPSVEEKEYTGDNSAKIRGILSKPGGENNYEAKKRPGRRVQFADRYEKLYELEKKYGARVHKVDTAIATSQTDFERNGHHYSGEVTGFLQERDTCEVSDLRGDGDSTEEFQCLSRSSSLPDIVSTPLSGSSSPFKAPPRTNEVDSAKRRPVNHESSFKLTTRMDSPLKIIRNPYKLFPPRIIRAKTSITSQRPYVIYRYDVTGDNGKLPRTMSSLSSSLQRAQSFLSVRGHTKMAVGGPLPRRPLASLCDASKTRQIIQWLHDVDVTQAKEGKCTASLLPASHYDRTA